MGQLNKIVTEKEPERQYYFIELLKDEIKKKAEKKGMPVRKNRKSSAVSEKKTETKTESQLYTEIFLWILVAVSILLMLSNFGAGGIIGSYISNLFFGLFGSLIHNHLFHQTL